MAKLDESEKRGLASKFRARKLLKAGYGQSRNFVACTRFSSGLTFHHRLLRDASQGIVRDIQRAGYLWEHNDGMATLHKVDDRSLLIGLLNGEGDFRGPASVLDGLTAGQALAKPYSLPHSIAEIVAHMCYWQEWFNGCAAAGFTGIPEHAAVGWPAVSSDGWDALRARYLNAIEEAKRIVAVSDSLAESLLPPGVEISALARESRGSGILRAAIHSGHPLGQIVTMRQLMGLWPPAAGSMTW